MVNDIKYLLSLLGVPYIDSPSEAEAQCAALVKSGKAYAVASEDMDSLAFGAPLLLRGFGSKREPLVELNLDDILQTLEMTHHEFVAPGIMRGGEYASGIEGIGFHTAFRMIKQMRTIEKVLAFIEAKGDTTKFRVPDFYPYIEARQVFLQPEIDENVTFHWGKSDAQSIFDFLVRQKGFSTKRVEIGL